VFRRARFAFTVRWFVLHLLCLALVVTMVLLGRWQLRVSNRKHFDLQNFGYALQWWSFSAFVIVMWVRMLRDASRRETTGDTASPGAEDPASAHTEVAYRRYVMPTSADVVAGPEDPTRAAYNDYLAGLAQRDAAPGSDAHVEGTSR
jgi:DNA-binding transcriptional regulator of glucitol operon